MKFVRTEGWGKGTQALVRRLQSELKKNVPVLWLVCGGSNIPASVEVMKTLPDDATKNLAVMLTDERYGEVGHIHSNAKQLMDAGFESKQAIFVPTLVPGHSLQETKIRYEEAVRRAFEHANVIIAQFGIGADGHLAGILPHSPAAESTDWVAAYETAEHTRVTLTFEALRHITAAYAFVFGGEKKPALLQLRDENLPLADQPSQILKELSEAYVYNDQIGEK
ncbi:MAG TPA: 6-phosphogluconolactonase [Candidatus Saccharimonadales bacterium]|nr:6-phosphogluconolactonase [Candidatus Saccharimonadales bacterium]